MLMSIKVIIKSLPKYEGVDMSIDIKDKETNPKAFKRMYKRMICNETGKCSICPWHRGENYGKRPKDDRYKDKRKGKI